MPQSKSPAYAARVNIVKKVKVGWEWKTLSVVRDDEGRIRWDYVLVNGQVAQVTTLRFHSGIVSYLWVAHSSPPLARVG